MPRTHAGQGFDLAAEVGDGGCGRQARVVQSAGDEEQRGLRVEAHRAAAHARDEVVDLVLHADHKPAPPDLAPAVRAGAGAGHGEIDAARVRPRIVRMGEVDAEPIREALHRGVAIGAAQAGAAVGIAVAEDVQAIVGPGHARDRAGRRQLECQQAHQRRHQQGPSSRRHGRDASNLARRARE